MLAGVANIANASRSLNPATPVSAER